MSSVSATSKIPSILRRRYSKCKELFDPVQAAVEVNKNLYRGTFLDSDYEWDYSLVDNQVFPLIRNYLSRSNPSMTKIRLDPRKTDDYEKRQVNQDFVNWELSEILLTTLYYRMYYSGYIAGKGYAKTGWKYEPAVSVQVKDDRGNVQSKKIMRDIINRADAQFVRFNDLLVPNQNNPILYEQPYLIELIQMRVGDMIDENESLEERGENPYWSKKFIEKLRKSGVESKLLDYQMEMVTDTDSKEDFAFKSAYVALMCMHTIDGEDYYMPLQGDETVINTDTESRYWHGHYPFIDFTPFPSDDEYYSPSVVDVTGDIQIASTEVLNQTMTNIRQINTDMWVAGTGASQTPDWQFRKRPDGVIRVVGDPTQVSQIRTQDNTLSALRFSQDLQTKAERTGGISSLYSSGAPNKSVNQTARGAQIIDQNIDQNLKMVIDLFGEQVIKRMGEHFLELNAQYVTEEQVFYVTGRENARDIIAITPEQVTANFDVFVNPESMIKQTPASRQQNLQNLMQVLSSTAQQTGVVLDIVPLVEALIDSYPDMENVEDVVMSVDEKSKRDISLLERGQMPEIKVKDSHLELIIAVNIHFEDNQDQYPEEIAQVFEDYVTKHMRYIQAEQEIQMMSQPQIPQANMGLEGQMTQPGMEQVAGQQEGLPSEGYDLGQIV